MVFITGVSGFVGNFTARKLIQQGYTVRALRRPHSDLSLIQDIAHKIDWIEGDLFDISLLSKEISSEDIVIHSAAIVSFAPSRRKEMYQANVEGTANLVNICLEKQVKKFCFVSSVAALGRTKLQSKINENSKWEESELNTSYAQTKYLAEQEVWRGAAEGLPVLIVNPSVILGPGDWNRSSSQLFQYAFNENFFYPQGSINYVDIRDVADAIFSLISSDITGEKFILNAGTVTYRELLEQIARRFGKKPPRWQVQSWMPAVAWRLEWIKSLFSKKEPFLTRETARISKTNYVYQNDKIRRQLGFSFRNLEETLDWSCQEILSRLEKA